MRLGIKTDDVFLIELNEKNTQIQNLFLEKIKKIIIEIHSEFLKAKGINEDLIYAFLKKHGFKIKKIQEIPNKQTSNFIATKN